MKFNRLVFSLFVVSRVFGSEESQIDSMKNIVSAISIVTAFSMTNLETKEVAQATAVDPMTLPGGFASPKKVCQKARACQLHKEVMILYNNSSDIGRYNPIQVSENNEVKDPKALKEIQDLAERITLRDKVGNVIYPLINPKTNKLYLPLMQEGNECPDYVLAKEIIAPRDNANPVGRVGLVKEFDLKKFDQMKKDGLICGKCKTTRKPSIPQKSHIELGLVYSCNHKSGK